MRYLPTIRYLFSHSIPRHRRLTAMTVNQPLAFVPSAGYAAAAAEATVAGQVLNAAGAAVTSSLVGSAAAVAGAGLAGFAIGSAILSYAGGGEQMPPLAPATLGGTRPGLYQVTYTQTVMGGNPSTLVFNIQAPFSDITYRVSPVGQLVYFVQGINERVDLAIVNRDTFSSPPQIISAIRLDGQPDNGLRPRNFRPTPPFDFPRTFPGTITIPGETVPIPITPEVYPAPESDPNQEPEKKVPGGVIVKIPETGEQLTFTPDGVVRERYVPTPTEKLPTRQPIVKAPDKAPATDECPCPEKEDKSDEIVCRIKTLQKEILSDGYDVDVRSFGSSSSTVIDNIQNEFFLLEILSDVFPVNVQRQPYDSPAPNVVFLGWYAFSVGGVIQARTPIHFTSLSAIPPIGADGFTIAMNRGCQAQGLYHSRLKKEYIDLCALPG